MCEERSYQNINTSVANQAVFNYYQNIAKNYRKENINVDGSKQGRDTRF